MKINEINPFVRSANYHIWNWKNIMPTCSYDSRLFYMLDSDASLTICDTLHYPQQGALAVIPAGTPYLFRRKYEEVPFNIICVNFDYTWNHSHIKSHVQPRLPFNEADIFERYDGEVFGEVVYMEGMSNVRSRLEIILNEFQNKQFCYEKRISALMTDILITAARVKISGSRAVDELTNSVIDYIQNNYSEILTNEMIAEHFNYHKYYLSKLVKTSTGLSMHAYLKQVRLNAALHMLAASSDSVIEIALKCGFVNQSYFTTQFKNHTSMTPTEYRKSIRNI